MRRIRRKRRRNARRRRNSWPGDKKRHAQAARRGWYGTRGKTGRRPPRSTASKRSKVKMAWAAKQKKKRKKKTVRKGGVKRRATSRRKGGRKKKRNPLGIRRIMRRRPKRRMKSRGRRKMVRRRNGRRRRRNYYTRRNPQYGKGGKKLSMKKPVDALMAGYNVKALQSAAVISAGALANNAVYQLAANNVPMFPEFLKDGPGEIAGKLAMAGITGAGVGMINAGLASEVFFGGVLQCVMDAFNQYVIPNVPGLSGLGDFLTRADFAGRQALGDYASVRDLSAAQNLGDYASVQALSQAQNLGSDGQGESYIAEELAAIA